jgi:hypothetical protein
MTGEVPGAVDVPQEAPLDLPQPDVPDTPEAPPAREQTSRDAISRALSKVREDGRDDMGRFAPKERAEGDDALSEPETPAEPPKPAEPEQPTDPVDPPPARFSDAAAKAEWAKVPAAVRNEVARGYKELEAGLAQYQERYKPIEQYAEMAERAGTNLKSALDAYVGMENLLRRDPMRGLEAVCANLGMSLKDVAAQVMGQPAPEKDAVIDGLRGEIAELKRGLGGVHGTLQEQRQSQVVAQVQDFAKAHPRFDELSGEIASMLKTGYASSLDDAYTKADRLNPAPAPVMPVPPPAQTRAAEPTAPPAHTRKGALSVAGAPTAGSDPARRQPASSAKEAVNRAMATLR